MSKHGVYIRYGETGFKLKAKDLYLIANALEIVSPDEEREQRRALKLSNAFVALAEYAQSTEATHD